jgi:cobalt-precorrin 5A hydrolase
MPVKLAVFVLTRPGIELSLGLAGVFPKIDFFTLPRLRDDNGRFQLFQGNFASTVARAFQSYEGLVFFSAVAVAVRAVAPHLVSKAVDPAVVVVDEGGRFAISLLAGHLGGANQLAVKVARCLGACPVVTTASDRRGLPAFDALARRWGWGLENLPALKHISAAQLEGREIYLYCPQELDLPLRGNIKVVKCLEGLAGAKNGAVLISNRRDILLTSRLFVPQRLPSVILRPRNVAAGVGCRKGTPVEKIVAALDNALEKAGLARESLGCLATGVFKAREEGLVQAAQHFGVPFRCYSREEILSFLKDCHTSKFVQEQVGVGAVAEPCARLGSGGGPVVLPCQRGNGITVSLAEGSIFPRLKEI